MGFLKLFSSLIHNVFKVREGNRNELLLFYEPFETEWFHPGLSLVFFCFSNFRKTLTRWHYRIEKKQFCQNPWPSVFFTTAFFMWNCQNILFLFFAADKTTTSQKNGIKNEKESRWKSTFTINKTLLPLKFTLFFFSASAFSILPYLTIHMKDIGIKIEHISMMYAILPFTIVLGKFSNMKLS